MKDYLTSIEILALHHALIDRYGGSHGVRDMGAIEAAALLESLLINHPFIDGNKRIAFAACDVFLRINGYQLHAEPMWVYAQVLTWLQSSADRFAIIVSDLRSCSEHL